MVIFLNYTVLKSNDFSILLFGFDKKNANSNSGYTSLAVLPQYIIYDKNKQPIDWSTKGNHNQGVSIHISHNSGES